MKNFFAFLLITLLLHSCARVGSPIGGEKDTLAPKFLHSNIDTTRVNVSTKTKELRLDFDEYVSLKDVTKNLIISPPIKSIKKILPSSIPNKFVLIQWEDTLQANTTYNFNFGNSIVDNNESNPLRYFNFAFSTGPVLDDMYISGEVTDGYSIKKTSSTGNKLVVGLYKLSDSINYREKPYYIAKVDDDGYYELNYLAPGKYKILAFDDENGNSVFDSGNEKIGFKKDSVVVEKSISGLNLKVFPSKKQVKIGELKEVPGGILVPFEGHPEKVNIRLNEDNPLKNYKVTHTPKSDSVMIWFNAVEEKIGQTSNDNLKFIYDADTLTNRKASIFYKYNPKNAMTVNSTNAGLLPPKTPLVISSNYKIERIQPENWTFTLDSISAQQFTAKISETNPYKIIINSDFQMGKKYRLTIPKNTVISLYDRLSESKRFDFEVDKIENYGDLVLNLTNSPTENYWVQLLDSSEKVQYEKYQKGNNVKFDILKPGEYFVRVLVDNNGNRFWDEADFSTGKPAEDVYIYYKQIIIRPLWNTVEEWDLKDTKVSNAPKTPVVSPNAPQIPTPTNQVIDSSKTPIKGEGSILTPVPSK